MFMERKKLKGLGKILAGGMAFFGLIQVANTGPIYKSIPEKATVVADGVTEYRMDVIGNTEDIPDKQIRDVFWQVYIPDKVTFTRSQLPDPTNNPSQVESDFFFNWAMDSLHNYIDSTLEPISYTGYNNALKQNERARAPPYDGGPSNVDDKVLGQYWFTVKIGETGNSMFLIGAPKFTTIDEISYTLSSGLEVENQTFTIVRPIYDKNLDGKVDNEDLPYFEACASGPGIQRAQTPECADFDRDNDNDVDQSDFGAFQRCLGANKDASSECYTTN